MTARGNQGLCHGTSLGSLSRRAACDLSKNRPSDACGAPNLTWQGLTSGVTKNRQVSVTKVTESSHFGNWGSRRAYPTSAIPTMRTGRCSLGQHKENGPALAKTGLEQGTQIYSSCTAGLWLGGPPAVQHLQEGLGEDEHRADQRAPIRTP